MQHINIEVNSFATYSEHSSLLYCAHSYLLHSTIRNEYMNTNGA